MTVMVEITFFVLCALSQANGCFQLITPSRWGARPANCSAPLKDVLPENVVIIHTAGTPCQTREECSRETRNVQDYHQGTKRWCDIAYSFLIGEDGYVYEGRGWRAEGAHTLGYNDLSLGVAFIGLFTDRSPNEAAWKALKCWLDFSVKIGYLHPDYVLMAHSDVSDIVSPGEHVRQVISKWPHYKHQ
ncbi:PREDICTED: peptidoglycan recognition protein 3-like [Gekko japonicus]|uniref:Peptidoglycan recognition protein 3-like n=1 Tax=Gekko japonicus TaxID=146911 RepID=A0ABM1JUI9_GEKJA|nr:PREDICTED: peptidoglycan recognition protein 3-like [Gekko japonicus]XP_015265126.1 PREDICTED: peptidoglycan recognition protein 3-like [Gekko japonicus]